MLCQRTINLYGFGIHARRYTGQYDHTFHGSRSTTQGQAYRQFHFANWKRIGMFARNEYHPPGCEFFPHQKKTEFYLKVKPANMVLSADRKLLKLCDFGIALQIEEGTKTKGSFNNNGTINYMAPEILEG